ncbi:MAG: hypothetical protein GY801_34595 [bacterium]|nr:hypothetical protein [bacterium]
MKATAKQEGCGNHGQIIIVNRAKGGLNKNKPSDHPRQSFDTWDIHSTHLIDISQENRFTKDTLTDFHDTSMMLFRLKTAYTRVKKNFSKTQAFKKIFVFSWSFLHQTQAVFVFPEARFLAIMGL